MLYYEESFAEAIAPMDANVSRFVKLLCRKGNPAGEGKPAVTATARRSHSFFGMRALPDLPPDTDVVTEEALSIYVSALERNGFAGPSFWYLNHGVNASYAKTAQNGGFLGMPVLFLHARYEYICECTHSRLAEPIRTYCPQLTEKTNPSGHLPAQEKPG